MLEVDKQNICCRWNDNNFVTLASNNTSVNPVAQQVKSFSQKGMNIMVDRADQNISLCRVTFRGKLVLSYFLPFSKFI